LLIFPISSTGKSLEIIDAFFTAVSASCVTGLVVVDTGTALSKFGQMVVLLLIQIGGLGIMTISTLFLLIAGKRPSFTGQLIVQDTFTRGTEKGVPSIIREVVFFTLVIEAVGAAILFIRFFAEKDVMEAVYFSIFHSISAFCNAGFALFPDSFIAYRNDWVLNLTIGFLIIAGGLGFLVLSELKRNAHFKSRIWFHLSLHSKLVLSVSGLLIIFGTFVFAIMEWHNTLASLSVTGRFLSAFFQSVTARTAGFNSIPIGNLANETLFFLVILMFIGASPGSCGGGIKTTTFASLVVLALSRFRGGNHPQVFNRTISNASIAKAISVVLISTTLIILAAMVILMSELGEIPHPMSRGKFLELLFEIVSAFGTVGLSTGITPELSHAGKFILSLVMFTGRLGPLIIAVAFSRNRAALYHYAEEGVMIG
jgi:trk system potassium uptake protein TrkH